MSAGKLKPFHFPRSNMLFTFTPEEKGVRLAVVEAVPEGAERKLVETTWYSALLTPSQLRALRDRVDAALEAATDGGEDGDN